MKSLLIVPDGWGAGLGANHEHNSAPDYVICQPDQHRPAHGLAMLTANLYVPQLPPLTAEEVRILSTSLSLLLIKLHC